jgi:pyruvate,orthophosphate dikinase
MMDIEFTIQQGALYMLQCRVGKRTGDAAIRIAVEMVGEKLIGWKDALLRVDPEQLNQLLRPTFIPAGKRAPCRIPRLAKGSTPAPAHATGRIYFNAEDAEAAAARRAVSWCASRHRRRTSAAWSRRRASSPRAAA